MMERETSAPDWDTMLDDVNSRLELMLAAAQARIDDVPKSAPATDRAACFDPFAQHAQGLLERMHAAEASLLEVEESLRLGEVAAGAQLTQLAETGRKLTAWAGRSIG